MNFSVIKFKEEFAQHLKTISLHLQMYILWLGKCLKSETKEESGQWFMTFLERHKQTSMDLS